MYDPSIAIKIHNFTSEELKQLLQNNGLPYSKLNKEARLEAVKQLVVEKWKNKLYFSWQASKQSSTVRYIKWKLEHNRSQATLPTSILPRIMLTQVIRQLNNSS